MNDYKIIEAADKSYYQVKRYAIIIKINPHLSKDKIRKIIIEITEKYKHEKIYHNEISRQHWENKGNPPADIIWIDVTKSMKKALNAKWVCQTIYINQELKSEFYPQFDYRNSEFITDGNIYIDWRY